MLTPSNATGALKRAQELKSGFTQAELRSLPEAELELLIGALEAQAVARSTVDSIRRSVRQRALVAIAPADIVKAPAGYAHRECEAQLGGAP